ncbi:MAG: RluA family pseudouridine synthase [Firmicutes bacterium]|nr:RluA family pseudouridine synthase [Bacillota bacterium]
MSERVIRASAEDAGERIDKFISDRAEGISRSLAAKLCVDGAVTADGKPAAKNYKIKGGEIVAVTLPEPKTAEVIPQNIPLDVVYEDDDVIVVNKPQGMVVHPAAGNPDGTLVNALMYRCGESLSAINGVIRPGIVHRIDKDTSGLIVAAKTNEAHLSLAEQLKARKPLRKYIALVNGNIKEDGGTVNKPIARSVNDRKRMAVSSLGRDAVTHYKALERFGGYTLTECVLETGRTHQIRVHMASIGHSIVGDKVYGIKKEQFNLNGQLLHAQTIGFTHPRTGELMTFSAQLPDYFERGLSVLRNENGR